MNEQWQELKETITEMRDSCGTLTQQEVCKFLLSYMKILEKQMQEPVLDKIRSELIQSIQNGTLKIESGNEELFHIIDKYGSESEVNRNDNKK